MIFSHPYAPAIREFNQRHCFRMQFITGNEHCSEYLCLLYLNDWWTRPSTKFESSSKECVAKESKKERMISGVTQFELCFLFSYVNTYNFVNHFLITIKICRINLYYFAHSIVKKL